MVNNKIGNSINILSKDYFDDLSSTSSYEDAESINQSGGSLAGSLNSPNVFKLKNVLLSPEKAEENNMKTVRQMG